MKQMPLVVDGSKGSLIYISQMSVCVGQQSLQQEVVAYPLISATFNFRHWHRTLPVPHLRSSVRNFRVVCELRLCRKLLPPNAARLVDERKLLREFIFPRVPTTQPHYLPVNMHRILRNAVQITISIAASQVTLSQHTLLMKCMNWASGLSLFAETTLSVKAQLEANGTWNY